MSKSIEEFLKYAESRMSEIEMYDALIKEAMYKEAAGFQWLSRLNPLNYIRKVPNKKWDKAYEDVVDRYLGLYYEKTDGLGDLPAYLDKNRSRFINIANKRAGKPMQWEFGYKPPVKKTKPVTTTPVPSTTTTASTSTSSAPAKPTSTGADVPPGTKTNVTTGTGTAEGAADTNAAARTGDVQVPGSEATKDPNLKWKALTYGGIPAASTLTWLGTSSSGDLEEQNNNLVQQVNDYQKQIQQMRDSAQVGDSFANMNFFERLLFLLLGPAMFKYMGSGSSNL